MYLSLKAGLKAYNFQCSQENYRLLRYPAEKTKDVHGSPCLRAESHVVQLSFCPRLYHSIWVDSYNLLTRFFSAIKGAKRV